MTITTWVEEEPFTARIYKRLAGRPDLLWANTYELVALGGNVSGSLGARDVLTLLALWESKFHLPDVEFDRGVFSTYVEDGETYDPQSFVALSYTAIVGQRNGGAGQALPLDQTLFMRRVVEYGRTGRALYRRCLTETDVAAPSGAARLETGSRDAIQTLVNGNVSEPLEPLVPALASIGVRLVMLNGTGAGPSQRRNVTGFDVAGVVPKKLNNAFFNRRTPTPTPTPTP